MIKIITVKTQKQIKDFEDTLSRIRSKSSSSDEAASVLSKFLIG